MYQQVHAEEKVELSRDLERTADAQDGLKTSTNEGLKQHPPSYQGSAEYLV